MLLEPDPFPHEDEDSPALALDRTSFEQVMARTRLCEADRIRAALERADHDDAAIRALACGKLGLPLGPELIAEVLVGTERPDVFVALARQMTGEIVEPLLDLLRRRRFAETSMGLEQMTFAAFALWQRQALAGV
ncbi:MAG TPA: hypothetical protein VF469_29455, partial [Kofleriaceae bacterium]